MQGKFDEDMVDIFYSQHFIFFVTYEWANYLSLVSLSSLV